MKAQPMELIKSRRLLPLFVTQFLGALNDNLLKNALIIVLVFRAQQASDGEVLGAIAAGLFILPFFFLSATAGQLADRFPKHRLIRIIKFAEIPIMGFAATAFFAGSPPLLLAALFLMGVQSAFFGPLKYAILPEQLEDHELMFGNGMIEAGTFVAILIGTILGGLLVLTSQGTLWVSLCLVAVAALGWIVSLTIPATRATSPHLKINPNLVGETWNVLKHAKQSRVIFLSVLGISWFWALGAGVLTQMPAFSRNTLAGNSEVVTLCLTVFTIGIAFGSLACNRLLKGEISAKFVPLGAFGLSLFAIDLYVSSLGLTPPPGTLVGAKAFMFQPESWRVLLDLFGMAFCGGLYVVPLYTMIQHHSEEDHRARTIAANNVMNAAFMTLSAGAIAGLLAAGFSTPEVFLTLAVLNIGAAVYACKLLPGALMKSLLTTFLHFLYRTEVAGWENYRRAAPKSLIIANHVSFLDGILLAVLLPDRLTFAINTHMANRWWVRIFLLFVDYVPLDPTKPMSTKRLISALQDGKRCVIFPEGRLTVTGGLMKVYEGAAMVADKAGAELIPIRIDGAQFTPFSRLKGKIRQRWFPKIKISVLPPQKLEGTEGMTGRARRQFAAAKLYDVMCELIFGSAETEQTLYQAFEMAARAYGPGYAIVEDINRTPLTYKQLRLKSLALGGLLSEYTELGEAVGLLLPNSAAGVAAFVALQSQGRVPAMLNFSAGRTALQAACKAAEVKTVVTSRQFIEKAKLEDTLSVLQEKAEVLFLEDLAGKIGIFRKLRTALSAPFARWSHARLHLDPHAPAAILFTSGSEGVPKAVVLSHSNLLSNIHQMSARVDFTQQDIVFNALPIFHAFGLTVGTLLPLFFGVRCFLYPSPLHYRLVSELVYDSNATVLFGTDTFLNGYARVANPYDFYSVRYVFAGAEKVKDSTRQIWFEKFGIRLLEGYGATETAPVLATNTPMAYKAGTVGRFVPGVDFKLESVPGIDAGGRLLVSGPNIMMGYYKVDNPGVLQSPEGGWYDTGDIVDLDTEDFITIRGRAKRFAKIGGEMVSLAAVEELASALWPEGLHAVVPMSDPRKGEQLFLLTSEPSASRDDLLTHIRTAGHSELMVPKAVFAGSDVPILASGKVDYPSAARLTESLLPAA